MIPVLYTKNDFYLIDKSKNFERGRIAWAIILYTPSNSEVKRVLFDNDNKQIGYGGLDKIAFTERSHGPIINSIRLEINEEILLIKAKKRPVILLQNVKEGETWQLIQRDRRLDRHLKLSKIWLLLPLYRYFNLDHKTLVEHLYYPAFFPMVANDVCPEESCFARFDQIQMTHMTLIQPIDFKIKAEILHILIENLVSYFTDTIYGDSYPYLREFGLEALKDNKILK